MAQNDFKSFATGSGANVTSQADWEALSALVTGFQSGKASSAQINKAIRQASFIAAALAQYTSDKTGGDVLDDGDQAAFITKMAAAFGKDFQPLDATLTALAALTGAADKLPYFTGPKAAALADLTAFAREILAQTDAAGVLSKLGLGNVAHSQMTTYLTAGTFTFTVPDGVYRIKCRVIGGGGGAGGSASAKSGGGGGAGGYAEGWVDVTPGQTITITVGIGGSGGTAGNFGVSGGLSSVGGFMSASGGAYGDAGGGGTGAGGFGGTGTGGSVNSVGSDGSDGTTTGAVGAGAGGGSALGGSTRSGGSGRNSLSIGGGGSASYTTTAQSGGNGHAGAVILEY